MQTNNNPITVTEFLGAFFANENETINLRTFKAKDAPREIAVPARKFEITRSNLPKATATQNELIELNENCGVYFVVNSGGNADAEINRYNAFFVENDNLPIEAQHEALDNAPTKPSIRVETKKSVHAYWLIDGDCSEEDWREIQAGLISYFDGDKQNKNPSRCMRVPYFDHVSFDGDKPEYKAVKIVAFDSEKRFTVEEMKAEFPAVETFQSQLCDNRDNCDDLNPTYDSWELLNAELGNRIKQAGKLNRQGKYEMRCPNHNGKTDTSLFFNPYTNKMKCLAGCPHSDLLKAFGLPTKPTNGYEAEIKDTKQSQASLLVAIAEEIELFVSQDDVAYATVPVNNHFETCPVESKAFENWIARRYTKIHNQAPTKYPLEEAIGILSAEARYGLDTSRKQVFTRIAELDDVIYLDLINDKWEVIKITRDGWEVVSDYPVKFRRVKGMKALPIPDRDGRLDELNEFLNIHDDNLKLVKAWLLACLKPNTPYPVLVLQGEQGSAKSTACEILCELIDPNKNNLRSAPKDERDIAISATNRLLVCLDNLSGVKTWLSDTLCRISTGGGFSTKKLYTDDEEMIFNLNNPILLNGIDEIATRSDLLDRSIVIYLPTVEVRKPEQEFWAEFESKKSKILGALLDAFCEALRNIDNVILEDYPRMADFTKLATAGEKALGLESGEFVDIYNNNREEANNLVIEISLIAPIVIDLVSRQEEWVGIAKDIKDILDRQSDPITQKSPYYPKSSLKVANDLRRLAPNLRLMGIDVEFAGKDKREAGTGNRPIRIKNMNFNSSQSSQSSQNQIGQQDLSF